MTLEEMKKACLTLIEEYSEDADLLTDDEDIGNKLNSVINAVQNELAEIKRIPAKTTMEVSEGDEITLTDIDKDIYQLNIIREVDYTIVGDTIIFNEDGEADIYYYKYPTQIDDETEDEDFEFDLGTDLLKIIPYGVASDVLKADVSTGYGQIYATRYQELKQQLRIGFHGGSIYIDGGDMSV